MGEEGEEQEDEVVEMGDGLYCVNGVMFIAVKP